MSRLRIQFLSLLFLLLGLSLRVAADPLSVEVTLEKMPGKAFADVQARPLWKRKAGRSGAMHRIRLRYRSTRPSPAR